MLITDGQTSTSNFIDLSHDKFMEEMDGYDEEVGVGYVEQEIRLWKEDAAKRGAQADVDICSILLDVLGSYKHYGHDYTWSKYWKGQE